jgi:4-hydroxy-tetrahydrodipicolinate synthase
MTTDGRQLLEGVVIPVVTTMSENRAPDAQQMHAVLDELSAAGITKIMLFGSNGEGPVLGVDEVGPFARSVRLQWNKRAPGATLVVNVSGSSTAESLRRAEAMMVSEPDALVLAPPMYFRHTRRDIVEHYKRFAGLGVPIVAYNSPAYTGNDLTPEIMADLIELDHVVGLKDSSRGEGRIAAIVALAADRSDFGVNQGDEAAMAGALVDGAVGFTPGIGNLAPGLVLRLLAAHRAGDLEGAAELQRRATQLTGIHAIRPGVATMKAALSLRGVCQPHVSLPFTQYDADDLERLREFIAPWSDELVGSAP